MQVNTGVAVTPFYRSKPDIVIYRKNFVKGDKISAAVARFFSNEECTVQEMFFESEDEGIAVEMTKKELDVYQLIGEMVKVAGDLAVKCILQQRVLFSHINIHGLLMDVAAGQMDVLQMRMDFMKKETYIVQSVESIGVTAGFHRIFAKV